MPRQKIEIYSANFWNDFNANKEIIDEAFKYLTRRVYPTKTQQDKEDLYSHMILELARLDALAKWDPTRNDDKGSYIQFQIYNIIGTEYRAKILHSSFVTSASSFSEEDFNYISENTSVATYGRAYKRKTEEEKLVEILDKKEKENSIVDYNVNNTAKKSYNGEGCDINSGSIPVLDVFVKEKLAKILSSSEKKVFDLIHLKDFGVQEIADELNIAYARVVQLKKVLKRKLLKTVGTELFA